MRARCWEFSAACRRVVVIARSARRDPGSRRRRAGSPSGVAATPAPRPDHGGVPRSVDSCPPLVAPSPVIIAAPICRAADVVLDVLMTVLDSVSEYALPRLTLQCRECAPRLATHLPPPS